MQKFEFDQSKSDSNFTKHGIDFVKAQKLWNDSMLLEIPAKTVGFSEMKIIVNFRSTVAIGWV